MQHCIPVAHLKVGMYVVAMDCSWLASPFWRSRFPVTSEADVASIRAAGITVVTIDDNRGLGLAAAIGVEPALVADIEAASSPGLIVERRARPRIGTHDAHARARETVERAKAAVAALFDDVRQGGPVSVATVAPVVDDVAASLKNDRSAILNVTRLKTKDEYTYVHSIAVCAFMMSLGRQLELPPEDVRQAGLGGLLHDIGKMTTPRDVLEKPGALNPAERRVIESHPAAGHALLLESGEASPIALDVCLHHHERIDGSGYPFGLTGDQLSLHARMSAICDVYDAITSHRPYKRAWAPAVALAKMMSWHGHFDQRLLQAFIASVGVYPVGALVRLHSNRLGIVLPDRGDGNAETPHVRAFYAVTPPGFLAYDDVATHNFPGGDPIIRAERGEMWFGGDWPAIAACANAGAPLSGFAALRLAGGKAVA